MTRQLAKYLNNFFANVSPNTENTIPKVPTPLKFLKGRIQLHFIIAHTSNEEILDIINWFWTFKRITIELILLNPTKFEQIRKFSNEKKILKKVRKLKLPLIYIHIYSTVNIIYK